MSANVSDAGLANRPWRVDKADVQSKTLFMLLVSPTNLSKPTHAMKTVCKKSSQECIT